MKCELFENGGILDYQGLYEKGFGVLKNGKVFLNWYEVLYLLEEKRIQCFRNNKQRFFEDVLKLCEKKDKDFFIKYVVFRDLRKKGFVVKTGLKYGAVFRVYEPGKYRKDHSKYLVYVSSEKDCISFYEFVSKNRVAHSTNKKLLFAIVDEEEDVSYYEISWLNI
ncbi:MAG: tRNA-intron lyase [Candidatus Woesearchaeota archaeon]